MNQTIYFRKDIWDSFAAEPDKSKLINELLSEHYGLGSVAETKTRSRVSSRRLDTRSSFERRVERNSGGFCKNGHPIPDGRDRCLGKGCKYGGAN